MIPTARHASLYMCLCACLCVRACACVSVRARARVCAGVYVYIYAYLYVRMLIVSTAATHACVPSRCAGLSQTCGDALQHCLVDLSTDDDGASNALPRRLRPKPPGRRVKYGWTKLCQGGSAAVHDEASCLAIDRVIRKWKSPTIRHRCARVRAVRAVRVHPLCSCHANGDGCGGGMNGPR